jgi:hypothetical protein
MKRMILTIGVFLLGLQIVSACDIPPGMKPMPGLEEFIRYGNDLFTNNKSIPQKDIIGTTQNRHVPMQTDEWHTVYYDGMIVKFYRAKSAPGDLLSTLVLSDKKLIMPFGIRIGDGKEKVLQKLGSPTKIKEDELYYSLPYASYPETVTFRFSKGILKEVQWDFDFD